MDENEIYEILASYKQAIDVILENVEQLKGLCEETMKRQDEVEKVIFDQILNPAEEMFNKAQADQRFEEFDNKYGEKLASYNSALAPMEDDGFDLSRATFDAYDALPEDQRPDEEAYVNEVARVAEEKITQIKEALGIPEDTAVEITDDGEGNVEVKADENGDGVPETEVSTEAETVEETPEEGSGEKIDDPEEIRKFEQELAKEL